MQHCAPLWWIAPDDRLTADVYEGNITYDVFNSINYINYINYNAIFIFNNVSNYEKMQ